MNFFSIAARSAIFRQKARDSALFRLRLGEKLLGHDEKTLVRALTDRTGIVGRRDAEHEAAAVDLNELGLGRDVHTDGGRRVVRDVKLRADAALAVLQSVCNGVAGGIFHQGDHIRRCEHRQGAGADSGRGIFRRHDGGSGTDGANSIKTKAAIHWLSVKDALPATIRLYDRLFTVPKPDAGEVDFRELINKNSKTVMQSYVEPSLKDAKPEDRFQFERNGYYVADQKDFTPDNLVFNLAVALKDTFGK